MGPALAGQSELSPWSDGPLRLVGTADLASGAATQVIRAPSVPSATLQFGSTYPIAGTVFPGQPVTQLQVTALDTVDCEIVVNLDVEFTTPADFGMGITIGLFRSDQPIKPFYGRQVLLCPTRNYFFRQSVSVETDLVIARGATVTIYCVPYITIDALVSGSVASAIVRNVDMKLVVIRR
jgi:hypothetical protein